MCSVPVLAVARVAVVALVDSKIMPRPISPQELLQLVLVVAFSLFEEDLLGSFEEEGNSRVFVVDVKKVGDIVAALLLRIALLALRSFPLIFFLARTRLCAAAGRGDSSGGVCDASVVVDAMPRRNVIESFETFMMMI